MSAFVWGPIDKTRYVTTLSESPDSFLSECFVGVFLPLIFTSKHQEVRQLSKCVFWGLISNSLYISFILNGFWNQDQNYFTEPHLKTVEFSHALEHKYEQRNCSQLHKDYQYNNIFPTSILKGSF